MASESLFDEEHEGEQTPEQHDQSRIREQYRARLAEKLKEPEFRKTEGFPIGTDEAILALSDPPYYTACPNPFIEEWIQENANTYDAATDAYHREPFAADVSEGKSDPIYKAHSYHTKVPHKAIMRYILHYTEPGDVLFDSFCGTGMTGVAAQLCGDKAQVESLGYRVLPDGTILNSGDKPFSKLGARRAILNDLSPAATFIAYNYNSPATSTAFGHEAERILNEVEEECAWMYSTLHDASIEETERIATAVDACRTADELRVIYKDLQSPRSHLRDPNSRLQVGRINYTVWSDMFSCPSCGNEIVFWDAAINIEESIVSEILLCSSCRAETTKADADLVMVSKFDSHIREVILDAKRTPAVINYTVGKKRFQRGADQYDENLIRSIESLPISDWFPKSKIPYMHMTHERARMESFGVTHLHHFFTTRNLRAVAALFKLVSSSAINRTMSFVLTSFMVKTGSKLHNIGFKNGSINLAGAVPLVFYIPSTFAERNIIELFDSKSASIRRAINFKTSKTTLLSTSSATTYIVPELSVDYIFTDPPFGGNIMYSDLNHLWEEWLQIKTQSIPEAITNTVQGKGVSEYQQLMTLSFANYYQALRFGHWMTVEFHNSSDAVWNAIQEALVRVGFVVADVRVLNKKQGTFKQMTTSTTVKQDLVISCYKPRRDFEERFREFQGKPEGVIEFTRAHLDMLPVAPVTKNGKLETVAERTRFLLFDRMIAYHLQRGARIPLSAVDFYRLLDEQFVERDEMYFLPDQAARYDAVKARGVETEQLSIFVRDEKTAVQWVRARLTEQPQTLGDLTPQFMQELREWESHETRPELRDLLREYFIEGAGIWRVPDPNNEKDLEALRRNAHLKLFRDYVNTKGPLKVFRKEAVLEGFRHCWDTKQYAIIKAICEKIPSKVLQEIHEFVQFYDIAKDLAPETSEQMTFSWE